MKRWFRRIIITAFLLPFLGLGTCLLHGLLERAGIAENHPFEMELQFGTAPDMDKDPCGKSSKDEGDNWSLVGFSEPAIFRWIGDTTTVSAYQTYTRTDGDGFACGRRYNVRARLSEGDYGDSRVYVQSVSLAEKFVRPAAPAGWRPLIPGEFVYRALKLRDLQQLDDKYIIELPATKTGRIRIAPWPDEYRFAITVTNRTAEVPLSPNSQTISCYDFDTGGFRCKTRRVAAALQGPL